MSKTWILAVLAGGLATGCALDAQAESLDLSALAADEGYLVGTLTTVERHADDEKAPVTIDAPDINYTVIVSEKQAIIVGSALMPSVKESHRSWDFRVEGELSPQLFALKLPVGKHRLDFVELHNGNHMSAAPIGLEFVVAPHAVTYIGDIRLELNTTESLFMTRILGTVRASATDDRALFERLLPERFPDAQPVLNVAIADFDDD